MTLSSQLGADPDLARLIADKDTARLVRACLG